MPLFHLIILALIQGITEFLPISSSGHLVLFHEFVGGEETDRWAEDLTLDVAVHVGTLLSVLLYFREDVKKLLCGFFKTLRGQTGESDSQLFIFVIISSVPVILAGLALYMIAPSWLRSLEMMAWATLVFGALLWWADQKGEQTRSAEDLTLRDALIIAHYFNRRETWFKC